MPIKVELDNIEIFPVKTDPDFQEFHLPGPSDFIDVTEGPGGVIQYQEKTNNVVGMVGIPLKQFEVVLENVSQKARLSAQVDTGQNLYPGGPHAFLSYLITVTRI